MEDHYDPDLEARLYAEVHYTNDTYADTNEPQKFGPRNSEDVTPSIRSYAKKTGMIPKKHRALIDGIRQPAVHKTQEQIRPDNRSNQPEATKSISPLILPPNVPRLSSNPSRFQSPNPLGFTPRPLFNPRVLPNPPRFPQNHPYPPNPSQYTTTPNASLFNTPNPLYNPLFPQNFMLHPSIPPLFMNLASNFQLNPYANNYNENNRYPSPRQDLPRYREDSIQLRNSPNKSKTQKRREHQANLKNFSKKVVTRNQRNRDKNKKNQRSSRLNVPTVRKNPDRAARHSELQFREDQADDSVEIIEIPSTDENLSQSEPGSLASNKADEINEINLQEFNENSEKVGEKMDESIENNLEKSDISKNLETPNKNVDKSKSLETPGKNLGKIADKFDPSKDKIDQNKNLETPKRISEKLNKNLETPGKNLEKTNKNLNELSDKSEEIIDKNVDKSLNLTGKTIEKSDTSSDESSEVEIKNSVEVDKRNLCKDNNSKYNVSSKNDSDKSEESSESESESDSDESIFEVPVPPKPIPPLINLNDSEDDEDSDSEDQGSSKANEEQVEDDEDEEEEEEEVEVSKEVAIDAEDNCRADTSITEKQVWDCEDDEDDNEEEEEVEAEEERIETNIVLNCSQVQKSVPTLEELRNINLNEEMEADEENDSIEIIEEKSQSECQSQSQNQGSEKKRPRDDSRSREDSLKPLKVPRNDKESLSFEEYVSKPMPYSLQAFYSDFRDSGCMKDVVDIQSKMSRNPNQWAILDADLEYRRGEKRPRCSFCHQPGHKRESCPDKKKPAKCYMCGKDGHVESRCPKKMCLNCGKTYSSYRKTCEHCRKLTCVLCKGIGHLKTNCPDLWRRYHQTTTCDSLNIPADPHKVLKPSYKLSCCNCTRRGHESSTCRSWRWSQHFPSPISVTTYTDGPSYPFQTSSSSSSSLEKHQPEIQIQPQVSPQDQTIYRYVNSNTNSEDWEQDIIYPENIKDICYSLENCKERPDFLVKHFPQGCPYPIEVNIKKINEKLAVVVKTPAKNSTLELKKLMIQWMSRRPEDRKRMVDAKKLPTTKGAINDVLQEKFYTFMDNSKFVNLIAFDEKFMSGEKANSIRLKAKKCRKNGGRLHVEKILNDIEKHYSIRLLSSLYNFNLAPSAENIINDFQKLMELLSKIGAWEEDNGTNILVPQWIYMNFCWFNFELFTIHLSNYIMEAKNVFLEQLEILKAQNVPKTKFCSELGLKLLVTRKITFNCLPEKNNQKSPKKKKKRVEVKSPKSSSISNSNSNDKSSSSSSSNSQKKKKKKIGDEGLTKVKEVSLIVNGKINKQVLQREKLASRAQAAVDMAKKHGLKNFEGRAEEMVKKIKDGGNLKKNAIEQLWTDMVRELRGNNISVKS